MYVTYTQLRLFPGATFYHEYTYITVLQTKDVKAYVVQQVVPMVKAGYPTL